MWRTAVSLHSSDMVFVSHSVCCTDKQQTLPSPAPTCFPLSSALSSQWNWPLVIPKLRQSQFPSLDRVTGQHHKGCRKYSRKEDVIIKPQILDFPCGPVVKIHLPMQETRVRSLIKEDPPCFGATKPMHHNYSRAQESHYWTHRLHLLKPWLLEPMLHNKRSHCDEKLPHRHKE